MRGCSEEARQESSLGPEAGGTGMMTGSSAFLYIYRIRGPPMNCNRSVHIGYHGQIAVLDSWTEPLGRGRLVPV